MRDTKWAGPTGQHGVASPCICLPQHKKGGPLHIHVCASHTPLLQCTPCKPACCGTPSNQNRCARVSVCQQCMHPLGHPPAQLTGMPQPSALCTPNTHPLHMAPGPATHGGCPAANADTESGATAACTRLQRGEQPHTPYVPQALASTSIQKKACVMRCSSSGSGACHSRCIFSTRVAPTHSRAYQMGVAAGGGTPVASPAAD
jgi:hypothetical protein